MRQTFIAGNWKMYKTIAEATETAKAMVQNFKDVGQTRIMIAPPFTALSALGPIFAGTNIELGAQNMGPALEGAYTGEVSPSMLKELGVSVVILGHSERRQHFGETDTALKDKITLAIKNGLDVIYCVGEDLDMRKANKAFSVVENQLKEVVGDMATSFLQHLTIAYEPIWAIGTGETASPEDANAMHTFVRKKIAEWYNAEIAENLTIQYGGSVKPANAASLMEQRDIDGALVGGASLDSESFKNIVYYRK